jgi:hypothetical protein
MRILLLKTWLRNVGNGFIDKGARATLERAYPEAEIIETSGYPYLSARRKELGPFAGVEGYGGAIGLTIADWWRKRQDVLGNVVALPELINDVDLAVLPGCVLYEYALEPYRKTFEHLRETDVPLLLLGAGGDAYDESTQRAVRRRLDPIPSVGLVSRDETAYDRYRDDVTAARSGIDCAFFIDEWYEPPSAARPFSVATFDTLTEPDVSTEAQILRSTHVPFGDSRPFEGTLRTVANRLANRGFFRSERIYFSDSLRDYLFLYGNATETHSDRVHACVPTLVYGNEARFYFDTPRAGLFERVGIPDVSTSMVQLDRSTLDQVKREQVDAMRSTVSEIR